MKNTIVVLDTETTGTNTQIDEIIEFYGCKIDFAGNQVDELHLFIKPKKLVPQDAINVHHITNEMLADKPAFGDVAQQILQFLADSYIGGHNVAEFDVPILMSEFNRAGLKFEISASEIIDSLQMERQLFKHNLIDAFKRAFGFDYSTKYGDAHSAKADVLANVDLIKHQFETIGKSLSDINGYRSVAVPSNIADMTGKLKFVDGALVFNFGKNYGRKVSECKHYALWMLCSDFPIDTKQLIRKELCLA